MLSVDGKGVVIRPDALREATARAAAAKGGNKLDNRLSAGEKNGRKRMATLGTVYDAEPVAARHRRHHRRPRRRRDADDGHRPGRPPARAPKARSKWLCGSVNDTAARSSAAVFDQAEARDPDHRAPGSCWSTAHRTSST